MKKIFYLKNEGEFIESFESELKPLTWVYRWTDYNLRESIKRFSYSIALRELIENNYYLN